MTARRNGSSRPQDRPRESVARALRELPRPEAAANDAALMQLARSIRQNPFSWTAAALASGVAIGLVAMFCLTRRK